MDAYIVTLRVKIHSRRRGSMTTTEQELPAARARTRYLCPEWEETAELSCAGFAFGLATTAGPKNQSPRRGSSPQIDLAV